MTRVRSIGIMADAGIKHGLNMKTSISFALSANSQPLCLIGMSGALLTITEKDQNLAGFMLCLLSSNSKEILSE